MKEFNNSMLVSIPKLTKQLYDRSHSKEKVFRRSSPLKHEIKKPTIVDKVIKEKGLSPVKINQ